MYLYIETSQQSILQDAWSSMKMMHKYKYIYVFCITTPKERPKIVINS
jgi:hypothetical protein